MPHVLISPTCHLDDDACLYCGSVTDRCHPWCEDPTTITTNRSPVNA